MRLLVGYDGSDGGRDALALTRVSAEATGAEVLVVTVLPYGPLPIPYEILEEEEAGADLLVAGSRGYGPVLRVLLGSVSTQLLHGASCPVLVVPRPEP